MKQNKIIWGLLFIVGGIMVIVGRLGLLDFDLSQWVISLVLAIFALSNVRSKQFALVFFPLAIVVWINQSYLQLPQTITFWVMMLSATLLSIGCRLIFGKADYSRYDRGGAYSYKSRNTRTENKNYKKDDDFVSCASSFSSTAHYIVSQNLQQADIDCNFGSLQVYFDKSIPAASGAQLQLQCSFGKIELYIPRDWQVRNELRTFAGEVEQTFRASDFSEHVVVLQGDVHFGGVEIIRI